MGGLSGLRPEYIEVRQPVFVYHIVQVVVGSPHVGFDGERLRHLRGSRHALLAENHLGCPQSKKQKCTNHKIWLHEFSLRYVKEFNSFELSQLSPFPRLNSDYALFVPFDNSLVAEGLPTTILRSEPSLA